MEGHSHRQSTQHLCDTAEMGSEQYPDAAKIVKYNTYMDDIIESTTDLPTAQKLMQDIETLIIRGGFKLKEWIFSCDSSNSKKSLPNESNVATEKVLGVNWDPIKDQIVVFKAFRRSLQSCSYYLLWRFRKRLRLLRVCTMATTGWGVCVQFDCF